MQNQPITVTLLQKNLWAEFFEAQNEMIVTKTGRSIFPKIYFTVDGLVPDMYYTMDIHFERIDNSKYKFDQGVWSEASKGEPCPFPKVYRHPDGLKSGDEWMKEKSIEFKSLKITNNVAATEKSHLIVQSMHKYIPVVTVTPMLTNMMPGASSQDQFRFEIAQFIAVTAYQNTTVTQLKVKHNKYARGYRGENSRKRPASVEQEEDLPQDPMQENLAKRAAPWPPAPLYQAPYMPYNTNDMSNFYYQQQRLASWQQQAMSWQQPMGTTTYQQMGADQMVYDPAAYWPMVQPAVPPAAPTQLELSPDTSGNSAINYSISPGL